jgi:hypothetical protein
MQGFLGDDVAFYGFPLTPQQVRGDDGTNGWFIVFQEQPSEPRFDLPAKSNDLGIVHVQDFKVDGPPGQPPKLDPTAAGKIAAEWFTDPTRLAIHGHEFLPATT